MADVYVDFTNGLDGTGDPAHDGTTPALAWKTLTYALATVTPTVANNIYLAADTYKEDGNSVWAGHHCCVISRAFTAWQHIQPTVAGTTVIVQGADTNADAMEVHIARAATAYVWLDGITFTMNASSTDLVSTASSAFNLSNIKFTNCSFTAATGAGNGQCFVASGTQITGLTFSGCTFTDAATGTSAKAIRVMGGAAKPVSAVKITDCTVTGGANAPGVEIGNYVAGVTIRRCEITSGAGLFIGPDLVNLGTTTGAVITDCDITATNASGHAVLLSIGTEGASVDQCRIVGGDNGVVDKGTTTVVKNCTIKSGAASSYLCKGAVGGSVYNCTMYGTPSAGLIRNDGTGHRLNQSCSFRNLALSAYSGACLAWTDANDESPSYMIFWSLVIDGATGLGDGENPHGGVESSYVGGSGLGANLVPSATSPCSPYSGLGVHIRPLGEQDAYGRPKLRADADCVGGVYPQRDDPRNVLLPVSRFASET